MHRKSTHIIHRQVLDLNLPASVFPPEAQQRFKSSFFESLPDVENVFSSFDDPEQIIRIDKIMLDLGVISYDRVDELFSSSLCSALSKALRDTAIVQKPNALKNKNYFKSEENDHKTNRHPSRPLRSDDVSSYDLEEGSVSFFTPAEKVRRAFIYFLVNGVDPWWMTETQDKEINLVYLPVVENAHSSFIYELKRLLVTNNNALTRLLYQFSGNFKQKLLALLRQQMNAELIRFEELFSEVVMLCSKALRQQQIKKYTSKEWYLFHLLLTNEKEGAITIIIQYIADVFKKDRAAQIVVNGWLEKEPWIFGDRIEKQKFYTLLACCIEKQGGSLSLVHENTPEKQRVVKNETISVEEKESLVVLDEPIEDFIYVSHGGLVLLHPFLTIFFSTFGLLNDQKKFKDEASKIKAVHLLAFLGTGKTNLVESELPFCKFLCGIPIEQAIPRRVRIRQFERMEGVALLKAAIQHWSALKNTSPDGLREAFLTRKGKLDFREEIPALYMEGMAHDVLLEGLPWGIGYVQLPWMTTAFNTIWI